MASAVNVKGVKPAEYAAELLTPHQLRLQAQGMLRTECGLSFDQAAEVDGVVHQLTEHTSTKKDVYQRVYVDRLLEFVMLYSRLSTTTSTTYHTALQYLQHPTKQGWDSPLFDEYLEIERRNVRNLCKPLEVVEGLFTCSACGSTKTHSYSRQMRSADEPMTTFITCANKACGKKWKIN